MKYLFFDTETTGLPKDWKAPASDVDCWPRLVQIAWIICDEKGEESKRRNLIIRPEGFEIPKEASDVHGITTKDAYERGSILPSVLWEIWSDIFEADIVIAHNMSFDERVLGAEFIRAGYDDVIGKAETFCTLKSTIDFVKAPPKRYGQWKFPKLIELHQKLFGVGFDGAHDALIDVQATKNCFFELKEKEYVPTP